MGVRLAQEETPSSWSTRMPNKAGGEEAGSLEVTLALSCLCEIP